MLMNAVRFIRAHDDILLISHVSPDGDTLGSALALYAGMLQIGKRAQLVCQDPVPQIYRFLPNADQVQAPETVRPTDAVISVDCADLARTGGCQQLFEQAQHTLNVDHHGTNNNYANANYVQKVGATGELIYGILTAMKITITKDIATCLYAALTTDTGNFSYSNTTPDTLRIAAELLETGMDLPYVNRALFRTVPFHKTKLNALAVSKTQLYEYGRIGISTVTMEDMASCGATEEDTEGIIDTIRDVDTVEVAALLRESSDGKIRVSLRGKSSADVSQIAISFGGGGHRLAAGCTLEPPLEQAAERVLNAALMILNGAGD